MYSTDFRKMLRRFGFWQNYYDVPVGRPAEAAPMLVGLLAVSFALAGVGFIQMSRWGVESSERAAWTLFIAATGLPGYVGWRWHRRWPVMEACPQCSQATPRDRDVCIHCRTECPEPAPTGGEIFA
jgi:hypothetical protein